MTKLRHASTISNEPFKQRASLSLPFFLRLPNARMLRVRRLGFATITKQCSTQRVARNAFQVGVTKRRPPDFLRNDGNKLDSSQRERVDRLMPIICYFNIDERGASEHRWPSRLAFQAKLSNSSPFFFWSPLPILIGRFVSRSPARFPRVLSRRREETISLFDKLNLDAWPSCIDEDAAVTLDGATAKIQTDERIVRENEARRNAPVPGNRIT